VVESSGADVSRVPSLCFDTYAMVPETRPLPAIFSRPSHPRHQPIVQGHPTWGRQFPGPSSRGRSAIALPRSCSLCNRLPQSFVTFRVHHHMLCQSIDGVREQSRGPAGSCPPPSRLRRRPNFDHVGVNGTYCGEIEKSRLTPRNCDSRLGVHFPGN